MQVLYNCRPASAELFILAHKSGNCLSLGLYFAKCSLCQKTLQMKLEGFSGICIYVMYKCFYVISILRMRESQIRAYVTKEIKFAL
jgi:hypothetical protein